MAGKPTTRARQAKFLASFDTWPGTTAERAVGACLRRYGLDWLTDEQLAEITSDVVNDARFSQRLRARNRREIERRRVA